ncbi:hypothetical protein [Candidatus Uabimicrobium amorphum]|uniref:Uncharacterized protein n=1 Tax=Uabimicrobium amorphum TaxID=2596890 RepID=A0A5S9F383_UABAM|nr:hypothetical protein [Candidatus Uabimicrobium amorphum]BBM84396.1 hypothetical protein UABAM_02755 [Candidatus Uabimicrobium amorphum]
MRKLYWWSLVIVVVVVTLAVIYSVSLGKVKRDIRLLLYQKYFKVKQVIENPLIPASHKYFSSQMQTLLERFQKKQFFLSRILYRDKKIQLYFYCGGVCQIKWVWDISKSHKYIEITNTNKSLTYLYCPFVIYFP